MHLKQPGFTYNDCSPFTKNKERIQKFKETRDIKYIQKSELDKACFQHDMAYGDFKDLAKLTALDKVSSNEAFNIAKAPKYDSYQRGLASMAYNVFDKKSSSSGDNKNKIKQNQLIKQLAEELHKTLIRKFKILKRTGYSSFKDYI